MVFSGQSCRTKEIGCSSFKSQSLGQKQVLITFPVNLRTYPSTGAFWALQLVKSCWHGLPVIRQKKRQLLRLRSGLTEGPLGQPTADNSLRLRRTSLNLLPKLAPCPNLRQLSAP
jgi:hypothetical protein